MNISYKTAAEEDLSILLEMMKDFYLIENLSFNLEVLYSGLSFLIKNPVYGKIQIILADELPAGYIIVTYGYSLEFHGVDALIDEFYIREEYRRHGIGKQTLKYVEDDCFNSGIKAIHLEVDRHNVEAQKLYKKFGFADHDRYLMTKWIDQKK